MELCAGYLGIAALGIYEYIDAYGGLYGINALSTMEMLRGNFWAAMGRLLRSFLMRLRRLTSPSYGVLNPWTIFEILKSSAGRGPMFVICSTNLEGDKLGKRQTGIQSQDRLRDWR